MHQGHRHEGPSTGLAEAVAERTPETAAGLLTPADVRNKVFTTVRLREGYDLAQVDSFLDQVEKTLSSLLRQVAALKARLDATRQAPPAAGDRAARIVTLTQEAADRAIAMAEEEARDIVANAREQAEATRRETLRHGTRMRESLEHQIRQLQKLLADLREQGDER